MEPPWATCDAKSRLLPPASNADPAQAERVEASIRLGGLLFGFGISHPWAMPAFPGCPLLSVPSHGQGVAKMKKY